MNRQPHSDRLGYDWCDDHTHKIGTHPSVKRAYCAAPKSTIKISIGQTSVVHDRKQMLGMEEVSDDECIRQVEFGVALDDLSDVIFRSTELPEVLPPEFVSPSKGIIRRKQVRQTSHPLDTDLQLPKDKVLRRVPSGLQAVAEIRAAQQKVEEVATPQSVLSAANSRWLKQTAERWEQVLLPQGRKPSPALAAELARLHPLALSPDFSSDTRAAYAKILRAPTRKERARSKRQMTEQAIEDLRNFASTAETRKPYADPTEAGGRAFVSSDSDQSPHNGRAEDSSLGQPADPQNRPLADEFQEVSLEQEVGSNNAVWHMDSLDKALEDDQEGEEWQYVKELCQASYHENGKNALRGGRGWFWS